MEQLNKQQIVLVTLLVSFVTSIATGIVTVSLMDQAPRAVSQTINRVVERTIERVAPSSTTDNQNASAASSVQVHDQLADAIDTSLQSLVQIKHIDNDGSGKTTFVGFGIVVNKDGVVVADKSSVSAYGSYIITMFDRQEVPVSVVQSQNDGNIAFLFVAKSKVVFRPAVLIKEPLRLGQSIFSVGASADTLTLTQGFVENTDIRSSIKTSVMAKGTTIGSPLVTLSGEFAGIRISATDDSDTGAVTFYPTTSFQNYIPK